ncbi:MAG: uroporphyrinogen decarboxylase family protein [Anaerolineae bacterium]
MNSRDVIKRCIEFSGPERIGFDFVGPHPSDFVCAGWGRGSVTIYEEEDPSIRQEVPDFPGRLYRDEYGNIWGQLTERYGGEVVKGALQDGWEKLEGYRLPDYGDPLGQCEVKLSFASSPGRYRIGSLPGFPFAIMRYLRRMDHFLMDVVLHEEEVLRLNEMVVAMLLGIIERHGAAGADGVMFWEDWGTQGRLLVSPATWRRLFRPSFRVLVDRAHSFGMHVIMHSCGYIYEIIGDLIDVGIDVLQLDQPELIGVERLAREFGGRIAFYSPVDIQKVMQTGDKATIQNAARRMIELLGRFDGGFIAMDYGNWQAIDVRDEWAQWARDVFVREGFYRR